MNAVALKFISEKDGAPVVIASGAGFLAEKIQILAKANEIPIIKDELLASILARVPIGQEIPDSLYKAVASIFSFLYKLENELK